MIEDIEKAREEAWEHGLPPYLQHDLDAYKEGLRTNSSFLDSFGVSYTAQSTAQRLTIKPSHLNTHGICVRNSSDSNVINHLYATYRLFTLSSCLDKGI